MSWTVVKRKSVFQRTIYFNKQEMDEIRKTCTNENVSSLTNGRWETNDPKSRKDHIHTLDLARAGELAVCSAVLCYLSATEWMGRPNFAREEWTIRLWWHTHRYWYWKTMGQVKTTTNRKGVHTIRKMSIGCTRVWIHLSKTHMEQMEEENGTYTYIQLEVTLPW